MKNGAQQLERLGPPCGSSELALWGTAKAPRGGSVLEGQLAQGGGKALQAECPGDLSKIQSVVGGAHFLRSGFSLGCRGTAGAPELLCSTPAGQPTSPAPCLFCSCWVANSHAGGGEGGQGLYLLISSGAKLDLMPAVRGFTQSPGWRLAGWHILEGVEMVRGQDPRVQPLLSRASECSCRGAILESKAQLITLDRSSHLPC